MTKPSARVTVPEVIARFKAYHYRYPAWGSLHIVLEDGNVEDSSVDFCISHATRQVDQEGKELAEILLTLSKSQRIRISQLV